MVTKKFWLGISVLVMVFATAVSGCDNGLINDDSGNYGNNNSIGSTGGSGGKDITVVCLGDSLTAGHGATKKGVDDPTNSYPAYLQKKVSANVTVVNKGVTSDTTKKGLDRVKRDVLSYDPDVVIILLGANDFILGDDLRPISVSIPISLHIPGSTHFDTTKGNLKEIIDEINKGKENRKIFLVKFYSKEMERKLPFVLLPYYINGYNGMFTELAKLPNVTLIGDIWTGIWGVPEYMSDNIHPNAEGYKIMADHIYKVVKSHL